MDGLGMGEGNGLGGDGSRLGHRGSDPHPIQVHRQVARRLAVGLAAQAGIDTHHHPFPGFQVRHSHGAGEFTAGLIQGAGQGLVDQGCLTAAVILDAGIQALLSGASISYNFV